MTKINCTKAYPEVLQMLGSFLQQFGEHGWKEWILTDLDYWNNRCEARYHLNAYGGMESFNDIMLTSGNYPNLSKDKEHFFHESFSQLRSIAWFLANELAHAQDRENHIAEYDSNEYGSDGLHVWKCKPCGRQYLDPEYQSIALATVWAKMEIVSSRPFNLSQINAWGSKHND